MASTIRQSVTFTGPQHEALKAEAERLGLTVSDLVRRVVDGWRGAAATPPPPVGSPAARR